LREFIYVCLIFVVYAYIFGLVYTLYLISLLFITMHELRGVSMKLIFNPYIYNSMSFVIIKKREIVVPKAHYSSFDDD